MKKIKSALVLICFGAILFLPLFATAADVTVEDDWGSVTFPIGGDDDGGGLSGNSYGLPQGSITNIVKGILNWLLGILSAVSLIGFVIAGIWYLTAAGDETQIEKGKRAMLYSIVGVIVGLMGFVIFQAAELMLSGRSSF